jgi:hypothetical protein
MFITNDLIDPCIHFVVIYFGGQQDAPFVVSQLPDFVVSQFAEDPGGQQDSFAETGAV